MKYLVIVVALIGSAASAAERILDEETEAQFRALVPDLADPILAARIADDSQTFFYKSDRWWKETRSGSYDYTQYDIGRRGRRVNSRTFPIFYSDTYFQRLTRDIIDEQWLNAGGVAAEPDVREAMFISLPKSDGELVPMVYTPDLTVIYPNGTLFGDILCREKDDKLAAFEVRIRQKIEGKWHASIHRRKGGQFRLSSVDTGSCQKCHADAGTHVESDFGWQGVIGSDENYSFGHWAANVQEPGFLAVGSVNAQMIEDGLLMEYDSAEHVPSIYGQVKVSDDRQSDDE